MLNSLKQFDRDKIESILSALTSSLLPDPGIETAPREPEADASILESVKAEIHQLLRIDPSDLSPTNRAKVFQFLAKEMSNIALAGADIDSIKKRLGKRGDLRQDLYNIDFSKRFGISEQLGVRRNHVLDVLRHPEDSQIFHNDPDRDGVFYVKTHNKLNDRERFSLLVLVERVGFTLEVASAWRIYHSDVNLDQVQKPMDLLRSFVDYYGIEISVGLNKGKIILHTNVETKPGTPINRIFSFGGLEPKGTLVFTIIRHTSIQNLYEVVLAFALESERYIQDLRKHNVETNLTFKQDVPRI